MLKVKAFPVLTLTPKLSVGIKVIPLPVLNDCMASFMAPTAMLTSHASALASSYVVPPTSWNRRKVAAPELVFAMMMRPISNRTVAVMAVALLVSPGRTCAIKEPEA